MRWIFVIFFVSFESLWSIDYPPRCRADNMSDMQMLCVLIRFRFNRIELHGNKQGKVQRLRIDRRKLCTFISPRSSSRWGSFSSCLRLKLRPSRWKPQGQLSVQSMWLAVAPTRVFKSTQSLDFADESVIKLLFSAALNEPNKVRKAHLEANPHPGHNSFNF